MDGLDNTSASLKAARASFDQAYDSEIVKLDGSEKKLKERLGKLNDEKHEIAHKYGNNEVTDDDIVELNAGGKITAAKRRCRHPHPIQHLD